MKSNVMPCEKMIDSKIPVFLVCDSEYIPFAMATVLTLLEHTSRDVILHILHDGSVSQSEQKKCQDLVFRQYGQKIHFSVWKNEQGLTTTGKRFPPLVFVRLFLPEMYSQYDRCIYLDADVLVDRDICELFEIDMGDKFIGAVTDKRGTADLNSFLAPGQKYYYSGVLLLDMAGLRRIKLSEMVILHQNEKFRYPEQDLMNRYLRDLIFELDDCWNHVMPEVQMPEQTILHYVDKPWRNSSVSPVLKTYWKALQSTPWFYRGRAELLLYEIEASINSDWRYPRDSVLKAGLKLMGCFLAALYRRIRKRIL